MSFCFGSSRAAAFVIGTSVVTTSGAGCVYRTPEAHLPSSLPAVAPEALEVDGVLVDNAKNDPLDDVTVATVRGQTIAILKAARPRAPGGGDAHVRAHVTLGRTSSIEDAIHRDGIASMAYLYAPFGLALWSQELDVDVTMESGGRTFSGHGHAERLGSIYANARRRALAVALDRALSDASLKIPATGSE